jgi:hypothetical protein
MTEIVLKGPGEELVARSDLTRKELGRRIGELFRELEEEPKKSRRRRRSAKARS